MLPFFKINYPFFVPYFNFLIHFLCLKTSQDYHSKVYKDIQLLFLNFIIFGKQCLVYKIKNYSAVVKIGEFFIYLNIFINYLIDLNLLVNIINEYLIFFISVTDCERVNILPLSNNYLNIISYIHSDSNGFFTTQHYIQNYNFFFFILNLYSKNFNFQKPSFYYPLNCSIFRNWKDNFSLFKILNDLNYLYQFVLTNYGKDLTLLEFFLFNVIFHSYIVYFQDLCINWSHTQFKVFYPFFLRNKTLQDISY